MKSHSRRGITSLVEVLVAISVGSTVFMLASTLVVRLMRGTQEAQVHASEALSISRLGDQFREDIHAATDVQVAKAGQALEISLPEGAQARYELAGNQIRRSLMADSIVKQREMYQVHDLKAAKFTLGQGETKGEQPRLAMLIAQRGAKTPAGSSRRLTISAVVGRDHRFASNAKTP